MNIGKKTIVAAGAVGAFALSSSVGFAVAAAFTAPAEDLVSQGTEAMPELPAWQKNKDGETYGALPYDPENEPAPDLISVSLDDGTEAYVRSAELLPLILSPEFATPEEAAEWSRAQEAADEARGSTVHPLPVYDVEGNRTGQVWNGVNSDG